MSNTLLSIFNDHKGNPPRVTLVEHWVLKFCKGSWHKDSGVEVKVKRWPWRWPKSKAHSLYITETREEPSSSA